MSMSLETEPVSFRSERSQETVLDLSDTEIYRRLKGIEAATSADDARREEMSYAEIAQLFLDSHDERLTTLRREKQEIIVNEMLDNPSGAFLGEFLQLELLYSERSMHMPYYDGSVVSEFCTQNHDKDRCDYLFRHTRRPDGNDSYSVNRVFWTSGEPEEMELTWKNGELRVEKHAYRRGRSYRLELEGDRREQVLAEFFYDTIHASALQLERGADDREENDRRARGYLKAVRDREYLLS